MSDAMDRRYAEMAKRRAPILEELSKIDKEEKRFIVNHSQLIAIVETQKKFFLDFVKKIWSNKKISQENSDEFDILNEDVISVLDDAIHDYTDSYLEKIKDFDRIREQLMLNY